jgi:transposase
MRSTMNMVEVITRVERRRRWSREEKQRVVAESARPGRTVSQVARAHGLAPNLLFTWRRQFLAAAVEDDGAGGGFVPVCLRQEGPALSEAMAASPAGAARLEIRLPSGIVINVIGEVASESLRRVLSVLAPE